MNNFYRRPPYPPYGNNPNGPYGQHPCFPCPPFNRPPMYNQPYPNRPIVLKDYGGKPYVVNIEEATLQNENFRTALWTGENLQVTLMSIPPGEDIGLEVHPELDQFIRIEQGHGVTRMGDSKDRLDFCRNVYDDYAILIPAGTWHNLYNTGNVPMKLYSIYAPPEHPFGTVHETKADAEEAERNHHGHRY